MLRSALQALVLVGCCILLACGGSNPDTPTAPITINPQAPSTPAPATPAQPNTPTPPPANPSTPTTPTTPSTPAQRSLAGNWTGTWGRQGGPFANLTITMDEAGRISGSGPIFGIQETWDGQFIFQSSQSDRITGQITFRAPRVTDRFNAVNLRYSETNTGATLSGTFRHASGGPTLFVLNVSRAATNG